MKNIAQTTLLAFLLGTGSLATAEHHSNAEHDGNQVKHVGYSELGDPATVLEVKTEASRALGQGEVRVTVLAAPINPSDLLQIAGDYGVDPVLPARPGSEPFFTFTISSLKPKFCTSSLNISSMMRCFYFNKSPT